MRVGATLPSFTPASSSPEHEGAPGAVGFAVSPRSLQRRMLDAEATIAQAGQAPNSLAGQSATLDVLLQLKLITATQHALRHSALQERVDAGAVQAVRTFGNRLWSMIHPARYLWAPGWGRVQNATWLCEGFARVRDAFYAHQCTPVTFFTDDNVQLSGLWIALRPGPKPVMVVLSGNAALAELELPLAMAHARLLDVDVLLYNPRGVGLSLGDVTEPNQSYVDCVAALRYAGARAARLSVLGISLGAGLGAKALETMARTNDPLLEKIELFVTLNTFASLPAIIGHKAAGASCREA